MESKYWFDNDAADRVCQFFEEYLTHTKGPLAKKPFLLLPWQRKILRDLFGWKRANGTRRYRKSYIEVAKKNGKSPFAAGIALYMLIADGEEGAECYSVAASKDQASVVFDYADRMVKQNADLKQVCEPYKNPKKIELHSERTGIYRPLPADADNVDGLLSSCVIFDELHRQKNSKLFELMQMSTGAREQPLFISITTAGHDKTSICFKERQYAEGVLGGVIKDDSYYGAIYAAEDGDDWKEEATWKKANPSWGTAINIDTFKEDFNKALNVPSYENEFKRYRLNIWTENARRWITHESWDKCPTDIVNLKGRECYCGVDPSNINDITAINLLFPLEDDKVAILPFFFLPEEVAEEKQKANPLRTYRQWRDSGHLIYTPGNVIDHRLIRRKINELNEVYPIREIDIDSYNAWQLIGELAEDGYRIQKVQQNFKDLNAPSKKLESLVLSQGINHGGHPLMRWMIGNASVENDNEGNIRPAKHHGEEKIDGVSALIHSLHGWLRDGTQNGKPINSIYEDRGVLTL